MKILFLSISLKKKKLPEVYQYALFNKCLPDVSVRFSTAGSETHHIMTMVTAYPGF